MIKNKKNQIRKNKIKIKIKSPNKNRVILQKSKTKKVAEPEKKEVKINITESKIIKMLDFSHLEELLHLLNLLDEKQTVLFLEHYKNLKSSQTKEEKLDKLVKSCSNKLELVNNIRKSLAEQLNNDIGNLKKEITEKRKKGIDVLIEDLKTISAKSKIRLFEATSSKEDYYKVKKLLTEIKESLSKK